MDYRSKTGHKKFHLYWRSNFFLYTVYSKADNLQSMDQMAVPQFSPSEGRQDQVWFLAAVSAFYPFLFPDTLYLEPVNIYNVIKHLKQHFLMETV